MFALLLLSPVFAEWRLSAFGLHLRNRTTYTLTEPPPPAAHCPRPARGSSGEGEPGDEELALQAQSATARRAPAHTPAVSRGDPRPKALFRFTFSTATRRVTSVFSPQKKKNEARHHPKRCTSKRIFEHTGWHLWACSLFHWVSIELCKLTQRHSKQRNDKNRGSLFCIARLPSVLQIHLFHSFK